MVRPTLEFIELYSDAAENLIIGTGLAESAGEYLKQLGGGPALGLFQMEPATHDDIWDNWLEYKPHLSSLILQLETEAAITRGALEMIGNLYYATAMCRCHYRRVSEPFPDSRDAQGLARYWKEHYNTFRGAGSAEKAVPFFHQACGVGRN